MSSLTMASNSAPLLSIPLELRLTIYDILFSNSDGRRVAELAVAINPPCLYPLPLVNKQVRAEAEGELYGGTVFLTTQCIMDLRRDLAAIGNRKLSMMRRIDFGLSEYPAETIRKTLSLDIEHALVLLSNGIPKAMRPESAVIAGPQSYPANDVCRSQWLRLIDIGGLKLVSDSDEWRIEANKGDDVLKAIVHRILGNASDDTDEQE